MQQVGRSVETACHQKSNTGNPTHSRLWEHAQRTASTGEWLRGAISPAMPNSSHAKRHRSPLEIRKLLSRFHSSALSRNEFGQAEGLCLSTLSRYLSTQRAPAAPASQKARAHAFLELKPASLPPAASPQRGDYRLDLKADVVLEIPQGFSAREVATLVALVSKSSPR